VSSSESATGAPNGSAYQPAAYELENTNSPETASNAPRRAAGIGIDPTAQRLLTSRTGRCKYIDNRLTDTADPIEYAFTRLRSAAIVSDAPPTDVFPNVPKTGAASCTTAV
jgi:hypothetical protein